MIWKPIDHFDSSYFISNTGIVKSIKQGKEKLIKPRISKDGYYIVDLRRTIIKGKFEKKTFKVHRLVAIAFLPNPLDLELVNHIDGNKLNPDASNLEWCTSSHNRREAIRLQLAKLSPVAKCDMDGNILKKYTSLISTKVDGYKSSNILANISGRTKSAYGFIWIRMGGAYEPY